MQGASAPYDPSLVESLPSFTWFGVVVLVTILAIGIVLWAKKRVRFSKKGAVIFLLFWLYSAVVFAMAVGYYSKNQSANVSDFCARNPSAMPCAAM